MNSNPVIEERALKRVELHFSGGTLRDVNRESLFEIIRDIQDPEHPYTLERLGVVKPTYIDMGTVDPLSDEIKYRGLPFSFINISFKPTIPHCSMAGIIGLAIKHQVCKHISEDYWVRVFVLEDTHVNWVALNKQLNDKDRVMAAFENEEMVDMLSSLVPILDLT